MAHVFLAHDLKLDRPVALKVLKPDLAAVLGGERFLREITLAAKLEHPHILAVYDSGEADGILYYVMPYVEGESLRERLNREKQLPLEDALQIAREVADALGYAHARGVIHRDIKPENILLEAGHAVVADFGIARAIDAASGEKLTETGVTLGTPQYMSPEQAGGSRDLDGRSDLYSLGCVLHEMLAGQPPFTGATIESVVAQHLSAQPPDVTVLRPSVPSWVVAALQRSLAKVPADRFNPVAQFGEAIAPRVSVAEAVVESASDETGNRTVRRLWMAGGLAVVVLVVALLGRDAFVGGLLHKGSSDTDRPAWVLLTDFEAPPDDQTLGYAVRDLVATSLEATGRFVGVPQDQVDEARRLAELPDTARLTVEHARHLAYRSAVDLVIDGRIMRFGGGRYSVTLRAIDVEDGGVVGSVAGETSDDDIMKDVTELAQTLGDDLAPEVSHQAAIRPELRTASFAAYRLFVEAGRQNSAGEYGPAIRLARDAVQLDPEFASAWFGLSIYYDNAGMGDSSRWALGEAVRLADRLSPGQQARLAIETAASRSERLRALDRLLEGNPTWTAAYNNRANELLALGRVEEAVLSLEQAIAQSPLGPSQLYLGNYALALAGLGRIEEAKEVARRLAGSLGEFVWLGVAIASRDWSAVESRAIELERNPTQVRTRRLRGSLALGAAQTARGRVSAAEQTFESALSAAERLGSSARLRVRLAQLLLLVVSDGRATEAGVPLAASDTTTNALILGGLWSALAGDANQARAYRARLGPQQLDGDSASRTVRLLDGAIAASGEDWEGVVKATAVLAREGGSGSLWGSVLMARWITAAAFEHLGRADSAVAYFQMLAGPVHLVWGDLVSLGIPYSFAHFRLAGLYTQLEDYDRAKEHYATFLETFTDPDPEYERMVTEARAKLEELARGR